jgi:hypothetical protein
MLENPFQCLSLLLYQRLIADDYFFPELNGISRDTQAFQPSGQSRAACPIVDEEKKML